MDISDGVGCQFRCVDAGHRSDEGSSHLSDQFFLGVLDLLAGVGFGNAFTIESGFVTCGVDQLVKKCGVVAGRRNEIFNLWDTNGVILG